MNLNINNDKALILKIRHRRRATETIAAIAQNESTTATNDLTNVAQNESALIAQKALALTTKILASSPSCEKSQDKEITMQRQPSPVPSAQIATRIEEETNIGIDAARLRAFPMEGGVLNEWETPLNFDQVKKDFDCEPTDRLLVFIGPLEYAAGPDILIEALPIILNRVKNARIIFVGDGEMREQLRYHADKLDVAHAIRWLEPANSCVLPRLLRASESVILPFRQRVDGDEATVELSRRAGRPVIVTHGGPAHLVRHEETGLVTYDNANSMVWAMDRILRDSINTERMGRAGKKSGNNYT